MNVVNEPMLKRVAGVKPAQAKKIIEWRDANGPFTCREELRTVKGVGDKTYQQCVGFLRVNMAAKESEEKCFNLNTKIVDKKRKRKIVDEKISGKKSRKDFTCNLLDQTNIHPETYSVAEKVIKSANVPKGGLSELNYLTKVSNVLKEKDLKDLSTKLLVELPTLQLIIEGLQQINATTDIRDEFAQTLFRNRIMNIRDLRRGQILKGRVNNVTDFGVFIDVGVGKVR